MARTAGGGPGSFEAISAAMAFHSVTTSALADGTLATSRRPSIHTHVPERQILIGPKRVRVKGDSAHRRRQPSGSSNSRGGHGLSARKGDVVEAGEVLPHH